MSALPNDAPAYRPMRTGDLENVCAIEQRIYAFPWSLGNFADSLAAGYVCTVMECAGTIVGYGILTAVAGEAHLLNLSIDAPWQGRGLGRALLLQHIDLARSHDARILLLEVRPSNAAARALYEQTGFERIASRRGYYPAEKGREDALVMVLRL
ncbi:MAG: ribosomal-protein-alanine N-acetyltransferase [Betaproteobacteria bacterium]|nr:MAG: ribosomal-protein-alanine N-acetyltransferase [Betaproteobacteria bacterium]